MVARPVPPIVGQSLSDSCWAACLTSWSRTSPATFATQNQAALIRHWGEGATGGITPAEKIPLIAEDLGLRQQVVPTAFLLDTGLAQLLPQSPVMVAQRRGRFCHAMLAYDRDDAGRILVMDPNGGGRLRPYTTQALLNGFAVIVVWKP